MVRQMAPRRYIDTLFRRGTADPALGDVPMNKKELLEFREEVDRVIAQRKALGDFDANSKYMIFLLGNMRSLINHAIDVYPRGQNVNPNTKNAKANARVPARPRKHGR